MLRDVVHFQSKMAHAKRPGAAGEDLDIAQAADFVSCRTVKMRRRVNRRSGGWLVACAADGAVLDAVEFLGGESLTQRAAFVARLKERYPFIATVVHDDSCHLRRFMDHWCRSCPQLCFPAMHYVIDKFHAVTHCDAWCRANCAPSTPVNEARVAGVNSSACELLFSWFSLYRNSFRHMGQETAHFFVNEVLLMRNEWHRAQVKPPV